jgi:hypothetical protein
MEGIRFGIGLAAGLLVALVVVTVAGGLGVAPASVPFASKGIASTTPAQTSTTATLTATAVVTIEASSTSSSRSSATSGGSIPYAVSENATLTTSGSSTSRISSSTTTPSLTNGTGALSSSVTGPSYSSAIDNIARQPLLSNAVIFVPVLLAFLLGAFLYRVSIRDRERPNA